MSSNEVSYTLSDLSPFTSYTIRVTVHNGVSDQDPAGEASRRCEVTTTTLPNDVAQLDILSGLALWNVTDGSTQYEIRYNRTEDRNHGNSDKPLQVYYVDNEANYNVEVRTKNGDELGYWNTPVMVQFKARCDLMVHPCSLVDSSSRANVSCSVTDHFKGHGTDSAYTNFEDPCAASIARIVIRHGSYLDSIQVTYRLADGTTHTAPRHGGGGGTATTVNFEEGEEIVVVTGGVHTDSTIARLKFVTMRRNGLQRIHGPYGSLSVSVSNRFVVNANVVSFFGRKDRYIRGLGFKYRPN